MILNPLLEKGGSPGTGAPSRTGQRCRGTKSSWHTCSLRLICSPGLPAPWRHRQNHTDKSFAGGCINRRWQVGSTVLQRREGQRGMWLRPEGDGQLCPAMSRWESEQPGGML